MTKTFGEKMVRQKSLTVDVGDGVSTFRGSETMDCKLSGESTIKSSELEERQKLRVEEGGVIKFGILSSWQQCGVFQESCEAHSQVQNSTATKSPGSANVTCLRSSMI